MISKVRNIVACGRTTRRRAIAIEVTYRSVLKNRRERHLSTRTIQKKNLKIHHIQLSGGCSEGLDAFRFLFKYIQQINIT